MSYSFEPVWPFPWKHVSKEVTRFWHAEAALPIGQDASKRAGEVFVVARDAAGKIAGVSTAVRIDVQQLGFPCFFYRMFVGRGHRTRGLRPTGLSADILIASYRLLNERFQHGYDRSVLGLLLVIDNPTVMRVRNEAIWQDQGGNVVYIGMTPQSRHQRLWYFDGARIP